jgi:4'-phosphopantetheinyl transferase
MWESPPNDFELAPHEVHVWKAALDASRGRIARFVETLAQDERDRAARFHFENGRENYVAARGILRELLGKYLGVAPDAVQLEYTSHGKPLLDSAHASDLRFNLAHSGDMVLFAFVRAARIGIDVERCRPDFDGQRIADRFFTEAESSKLRAARESERVRAFTRQWTRKESFIKAHGDGLSYPLNAFAVIEDDDGTLRIAVDAAPAGASPWHIRDLDIGDDYAAAVTVELASPQLRTLGWKNKE